MIRRSGWILLLSFLSVACAAPVAPSGLATPTVADMTATAASPSESLVPTGSPTVGGAVVPADVAWKSLTWRGLDPADQLGRLTRVARGRDGLLAVGAAVPTVSGSRSLLWWSPDGVTWDELAPEVLGANAIVTAAFPVGDAIVALTVVGGIDRCAPSAPCYETRPPLRAWTSADGIAWSLDAEPLDLHMPIGETSIDPPMSASNGDGVLVISPAAGASQIARSADGRTWSALPADTLPAPIYGLSIASIGGGYLLTGESSADSHAHVLWSADGGLWQEVPAFGPQTGDVFSARALAVGSGGIMLEGTNDAAPGPIWWWSSTDGQTWQSVDNLAPLGIWTGEGAGSGLLPNGEVISDGERMVAYDTVSGSRAWTSFDAMNWTDLAINGEAPPGAGGPARNLTVTPIGLLWLDALGNAWFGEPSTD